MAMSGAGDLWPCSLGLHSTQSGRGQQDDRAKNRLKSNQKLVIKWDPEVGSGCLVYES